MRGSAALRTSVTPGGALAGPWVKNPLWRTARAVPSLDLQFADNKSLADAVTGQSLVTFTRASSGTYVDSQGVIRTATTNLLLRSEEFDNASWAKTRCSIATNAIAAPNGTMSADKIVEDSSVNNTHLVIDSSGATTIAGRPYVYSVFAKAAERSWILVSPGGSWGYAWFNLGNGTVGTVVDGGSSASASIISVGDGWYRCIISATAVDARGYQVLLTTNNNVVTYTGNGTSGLFIWGAQLEASSTVGEYIPTTSTINSAPRFDHAITSSVTNLLLRSEEFDNASWAKLLSTVSANVNLAPNGSATADKLEEATGTGEHVVYQARTGSNETVVLSVFCKQAERTRVRIGFSNFATEGKGAIFDLASGSVVSTEASGTDYTNLSASIDAFSDGWYRCTFKATKGAVNTNNNPFIETVNGTSFSFAGTAGSGIYFWGAQLEQSANVGTYVPTTTAAATSNTTESLGLLVEEQRTNSIRNNTMVGAVAGTPGTLPTNWIGAGSSGLSREVIGAGTESGIAYVDVRYFGTTTSALFQNVSFEVTNQIAAAQSSIWTSTAFVKLVGGSLANITAARLVIDNYNSTNVALGQYAIGNFVPTTAALVTQRYSASSTSSTFSNAATAFVRPYIQFEANSGVAIDITLRIGMPQLEQGAFATSVIPTTTAAATRSADVASITGTNFSSWYSQSEGTVFAEARTNATHGGTNSFPRVFALNDGGNNNNIEGYFRVLGSYTDAGYRVDAAGVNQAQFDTNDQRNGQRQSIGYAVNNFAFVVGGATVNADTSGSVPITTQLRLGARGDGSSIANGTIRRLVYWGQRLPNSILQTITQ